MKCEFGLTVLNSQNIIMLSGFLLEPSRVEPRENKLSSLQLLSCMDGSCLINVKINKLFSPFMVKSL